MMALLVAFAFGLIVAGVAAMAIGLALGLVELVRLLIGGRA